LFSLSVGQEFIDREFVDEITLQIKVVDDASDYPSKNSASSKFHRE
jgi:hypothetical protein